MQQTHVLGDPDEVAATVVLSTVDDHFCVDDVPVFRDGFHWTTLLVHPFVYGFHGASASAYVDDALVADGVVDGFSMRPFDSGTFVHVTPNQ